MEGNELMIGDWICYKGDRNAKIVAISEKEAAVFSHGMCDTVMLNDVKPVPLTKEILLSNGFKSGFITNDDRDDVETYSFVDDLDKTPQTVVWISFYNGKIDADTLLRCWTKPQTCSGENSAHVLNIKYVHELQHILKICGIKKGIMLDYL